MKKYLLLRLCLVTSFFTFSCNLETGVNDVTVSDNQESRQSIRAGVAEVSADFVLGSQILSSAITALDNGSIGGSGIAAGEIIRRGSPDGRVNSQELVSKVCGQYKRAGWGVIEIGQYEENGMIISGRLLFDRVYLGNSGYNYRILRGNLTFSGNVAYSSRENMVIYQESDGSYSKREGFAEINDSYYNYLNDGSIHPTAISEQPQIHLSSAPASDFPCLTAGSTGDGDGTNDGTNDGSTDGNNDGGSTDNGSDIINEYFIGGTVSGLDGSVTLQLGSEQKAITSDGIYSFAASLTTGQNYSVSVYAQPPGQICTVANASGSIGSENVKNVDITCAEQTFSVGGTVSGLTGILVLQNNGGDDLTVSANGSFSFATELANSTGYAITVKSQPTDQTCNIINGSGSIASAAVTFPSISCSDSTSTTTTFAIGGTASGLSGTLVLQNNGGDDLSLITDGGFVFAGKLTEGSEYSITVKTQPDGQICTLANADGTMLNTEISNIDISCADKPADTFSVGGSVTGLSGTLVLKNAFEDPITLTSDGDFTFPTKIAEGTYYWVTVSSEPAGQQCSVSLLNKSGYISSDVTDIIVTCVNAYNLSGTVSGLSGNLEIQNNGASDLTISSDGTFSFVRKIEDGSTYQVTVATQPEGQTCTVSQGNGIIAGASVNNITIQCLDGIGITNQKNTTVEWTPTVQVPVDTGKIIDDSVEKGYFPLIVKKNSNLYITYYVGIGTGIKIAKSEDDGLNWSRGLLDINGYVSTADFKYDVVSDKLIYIYSKFNEIYLTTSVDGESWISGKLLSEDAGSSIYMSSLIIDANNYYISYNVYNGLNQNKLIVLISENNGTTWKKKEIPIAGLYYFSSTPDLAVVGSNIYIVFDNYPLNTTIVAKSTNSGDSWSYVVTGLTGINDTLIHFNGTDSYIISGSTFDKSTNLSIFWSNTVFTSATAKSKNVLLDSGTIYIPYIDVSANSMKLATSIDNGDSWTDVNIDSDAGSMDRQRSSIAVSGSKVYLTYQSGSATGPKFNRSSDGGVTFDF